MKNNGLLVVLSAPSGCGKDSVFKGICKLRDDVCESVSATTRKPRDGEVEGVNYFFKSTEEFEKMISNDELLEYVKYNNCYYGTPIFGVENAIKNGKVCFLIIDVQGAQSIIKMHPDVVSIFLMPPSINILENRLKSRQTNSIEDIENRLKIAESEIKIAPLYKYTVVNDALEDAVNEINEIINNELSVQNS